MAENGIKITIITITDPLEITDLADIQVITLFRVFLKNYLKSMKMSDDKKDINCNRFLK
jgi:hypothetical protein